MIRFIFFFLFVYVSLLSDAQNQGLVFVNSTTNKTVRVPRGSMLMLEYQGYLKQLELKSNTLLFLNDSSIVIGKYHLIGQPTDLRTIKTEDITGFRKVSAGSQILKTLLTLGVTLGSYYAFSDNENLNSTERLAFSLGTGIVTTVLIKVAFPANKVKYKMKDGWKMFVL